MMKNKLINNIIIVSISFLAGFLVSMFISYLGIQKLKDSVESKNTELNEYIKQDSIFNKKYFMFSDSLFAKFNDSYPDGIMTILKENYELKRGNDSLSYFIKLAHDNYKINFKTKKKGDITEFYLSAPQLDSSLLLLSKYRHTLKYINESDSWTIE